MGLSANCWIDRAERDPISLAAEVDRLAEPIFPAAGFSPDCGCPHYGPIPDKSRLYCPVCHDTGLRDHPGLKFGAVDTLREKGFRPFKGVKPGWDQWSYEGEFKELAEPTKYDSGRDRQTRKERRAASRSPR